MGVDCVFVAENRKNITIQELQDDTSSGKFPGGCGEFNEARGFIHKLEQPVYAYCWVELENDLLIIHDGCRWRAGFGDDYKTTMLQYLKQRCGGRVGLFADSWYEYELDTAEEVTKAFSEEWPQGPPPPDTA